MEHAIIKLKEYLIDPLAHCLKITQNVALNFGIFTIFCPIKIDLSGYTVLRKLWFSKTRQN